MTRLEHGYCWQHEPADAVHRSDDLRRIAANPQNVHTNASRLGIDHALDRLLRTPVPPGQQTLNIVRRRLVEYRRATHGRSWLEWMCCISPTTMLLTHGTLELYHHIRDLYAPWRMAAFKNKTFMQLLDRAVVLMERHTQRDALWARFFEEMRDGMGYCLHGNMMRLLNTFSSFYDVPAVVAGGDMLQHRMAAIAALDAPVATKLTEARGILTELRVPAEQWRPWLEALEE